MHRLTREAHLSTKINVTKTFLPPIEEYKQYVQQIWDRNWLTNQGPLLQEFERKTAAYLGVQNLHFVANGTLALQIALKTLGINRGEVITTPFTYVATASSILWQNCKPVFVDIRPDTLCIDAGKIEAAITKKTKAIMPVHVFGHPCDVEAIDAIAKKHNLKVIYDAAHAFNVKHKGRSILHYGDISILSFHSTKLFHTVEGGALVVKDKAVHDKVELTKRFGHHGDKHYMLGINAKNSEFHAAMGLCNLRHIDDIITKRKTISQLYDTLLGDKFQKPAKSVSTTYNYAYYPVLFRDEAQLLAAFDALKKEDIFPRRYFYPSLNKLPYIRGATACPISEDIASRIACLPLYSSLRISDVRRISKILKGAE
jgi:dTDP-4-amino-4,6-dideoxygalactose transaminase